MFVKAEYYREKKTVHYFDEDGTKHYTLGEILLGVVITLGI
jgi:hypothetical protein